MDRAQADAELEIALKALDKSRDKQEEAHRQITRLLVKIKNLQVENRRLRKGSG